MFIKPFYIMIYHKFDRIIRPGFKTIAPFPSAQQPINSTAQLAHASVRRVSQKGYVK